MSDPECNQIRQAASGDAEAFARLVHQHRAAVYGYILARVNDFDWAEDLAQEAFVAALAGLNRLRRREHFGAYLRGIADNLVALWYRRLGRDARARRSIENGASGRTSPALPAESGHVVLDALSRLTPNAASALTLYYCDGLTQRQCAEFLGVSEKAIEGRLRRARHELKRQVMHMAKEELRAHEPGDAFDRAVAEQIRELVAVIGGPYKKQPVRQAEERLKALFSRNADRLTDLIGQADSDVRRTAARRMVRSLGRAGAERGLSLILSDDRQARTNALSALLCDGDREFIYAIVNALHESAFTDEQKVMLLIELIRRPSIMGDAWSRSERKLATRESSAYMEMLAHYDAAAVQRLAGEIRRGAEQAGRPDSLLARVFVRFGTDGLKAVLPWLDGRDETLTLAALELVRLFGEGRMRVLRLDPRHWRRITEPELLLLSREACDTVVHESKVDVGVVAEVGRLVACLMRDESRNVQIAAASALGHFDDDCSLEPLAAAISGPDAGVAVAAARSLGWRMSSRRIEPLVRAIEDAAAAVKAAACDSLVRLQGECRYLVSMRLAPDSEGSAAIAERIAAGEELEEFVRVFDAARPRVVIALRKARAARCGKLSARGELWEVPLAQRLDRMVEHWRQRQEQERLAFDGSELRRRAADFHRRHPDAARPPGAQPLFTLYLPAMVRALPEDREYDVQELNRLIRLVTADESASRRKLVDDGWMARRGNRYWLTSLGREAWRAERILAGTP